MAVTCVDRAYVYARSYIVIYIYIKIQRFSARYLKKSELLNRLRSFMDQFVRYIRGKVCTYRVFNIFPQYVQKISPIVSPDMLQR